MYSFCKLHNLLLYVNGARLACALTSKENDMAMKYLAYNCDAFYIGGTKNGVLFGEALVLVNDSSTNQVFPILPNNILEKLKGKYNYTFWEKID